MATVKRLNTDYTIESGNVIINGNLIVNGVQTSVTSTNTVITDKTLMLNDGEANVGVGGDGVSGIVINRGNASYDAQLLWNEPSLSWIIIDSTGTPQQIATGAIGGAFLGNVVEDLSPQLGGNLDVLARTITSSNSNVSFAGNLQLNNTAIVPSAINNATLLYAGTPGAGTVGLYVVNNAASNEELITKKRSFGFSLIL
jgi:hypothetical protein